MVNDRIKYELLKRLEKLHIVQCKNKLNKIINRGIDVNEIYPGRFINIVVDVYNEEKQLKAVSGMPGVFVKILSSKTGNFYFYFGKDSSQDTLVCDKVDNLIVDEQFVEIYDNEKLQDAFDGIKVVTIDFCRYYNGEIEFQEIFPDDEEK